MDALTPVGGIDRGIIPLLQRKPSVSGVEIWLTKNCLSVLVEMQIFLHACIVLILCVYGRVCVCVCVCMGVSVCIRRARM